MDRAAAGKLTKAGVGQETVADNHAHASASSSCERASWCHEFGPGADEIEVRLVRRGKPWEGPGLASYRPWMDPIPSYCLQICIQNRMLQLLQNLLCAMVPGTPPFDDNLR